ncbi:hypothetical protein ACWERY_37585 [Streptomyces sp. NPDC004082]|uniref:hypothetical protein n=1 Tax=unclassified Streptomyces TaxID=2593676 RepID=UPI0033B186F5
MRGVRQAAAAAAVVLLGFAVACGKSDSGAGAATTAPPAHARFEEEVTLDDGSRVGLSYAAGRGLVEQHRRPGARAWSAPHLVHRTTSDPCGSMTVTPFGTTVAVIANWGPYCADGEPPTESVAAVGTDGPSRWDTKVTEDFDGWEKVSVVRGSQGLRFERMSSEWTTLLRWNRDEGFAEVDETRR